jgi:hypothetical protein
VAFRLDREPFGPLWALPLQQFVYRQLMYLVIIESTISALVGARGVEARPPHGRRRGPADAGDRAGRLMMIQRQHAPRRMSGFTPAVRLGTSQSEPLPPAAG